MSPTMFVAAPHSKASRLRRAVVRSRPTVVVAIAVVLIAVGAGAALAVGLGGHRGGGAMANASTAGDVERHDAASLASTVGLQPSDLGTGFTVQSPSAALKRPTAPSACTPVSSEPWLADVTSPEYASGPNGPYVVFDVVVMPSTGDAARALGTVSAPAFGPQCYKPSFDQRFQGAVASSGAVCALSLRSSTIAAIPAGTLGLGVSGWRYEAILHCGLSNTTAVEFQDVVNAAVVRFFLQAQLRTLTAPPPAALEVGVMSAMAARARASASSASAPTTSPSTAPAPPPTTSTTAPAVAEVTVPTVSGQPLTWAEHALTVAGLTVGTESGTGSSTPSSISQPMVTSTTPPAGAKVPVGTAVNLTYGPATQG